MTWKMPMRADPCKAPVLRQAGKTPWEEVKPMTFRKGRSGNLGGRPKMTEPRCATSAAGISVWPSRAARPVLPAWPASKAIPMRSGNQGAGPARESPNAIRNRERSGHQSARPCHSHDFRALRCPCAAASSAFLGDDPKVSVRCRHDDEGPIVDAFASALYRLRLRSSRAFSRCQSRCLMVSRLSTLRLPLARPSWSLAMPRSLK